MSKLLAYSVTDTDQQSAVVVFAKLGAVARREGAAELAITFEEVSSCTRVKEFDQYTPGPVPLRAYLAAGWWFECGHCGVRFSEEGRYIERTPASDALYQAFAPVRDEQGTAYCCSACMMAEYASLQDDKDRLHDGIHAATLRWPMATGLHATMIQAMGRVPSFPCGLVHGFYEVMVSMRLPELEYPCSWSVSGSTMRVSESDAQAFNALYGYPDQGAT